MYGAGRGRGIGDIDENIRAMLQGGQSQYPQQSGDIMSALIMGQQPVSSEGDEQRDLALAAKQAENRDKAKEKREPKKDGADGGDNKIMGMSPEVFAMLSGQIPVAAGEIGGMIDDVIGAIFS